jgi:hypothetical protein
MKIIAFFIVVILNFGFVVKNKTKVKITNQSEVIIKGKSNVNSFTCTYDKSFFDTEFSVDYFQRSSKTIFEGAKIKIRSNGFDCAHKMITRDFKSLLQTDTFDSILIDVKEVIKLGESYSTKVAIQIAGVTKEYTVPIKFDEKQNNVKANLTININDFNLKPPKKVLGMVKVNESVSINLDLYLDY